MSLVLFGQDNLQDEVDKLNKITDMPYICRDTIDTDGCGDAIFWQVVKYKLDIIPNLINKLNDTTKTSASVPFMGGQWTVADIAFSAIQEIIKDIPTFDLLGVQYNPNGFGYNVYWYHLRADFNNRQEFKEKVTIWYKDNKNKLVWVVSDMTLTCDCSFKHPNGGHYELKQ